MRSSSSQVLSSEKVAATLSKQLSRSAVVIGRDHIDYERARLVYNRMHDHRPLAIVRTLERSDIKAVLKIAREECIALALRGGGHHIAGFGSCESGIVLDFSEFRGVDYSFSTELAIVKPGARLADVDRLLCSNGRVMPTGTVSDTGIAGLALGGGIGWLLGQFGLTCDHLVDAEVVLADGALVRASDDPDLLWALRGGGGNFGIVTEFNFRTHALPTMTCGHISISLREAENALNQLRSALHFECPRALTIALRFQPPSCASALIIDFCICSVKNLSAILDFLRSSVPNGVMNVKEQIYFPQWQCEFDSIFMPPMRGYWKSAYSKELPEVAISTLVESASKIPDGGGILIEHLHGAFKDHSFTDSAFPLRDASFGVMFSARWPDLASDDVRVEWVRQCHASYAEQLDVLGPYTNYASADEPATSFTTDSNAAGRLLSIKERLDPQNIFSTNHNIRAPDVVPIPIHVGRF